MDARRRLLLSPDQIADRVAALGSEISADYRDEQPILVGVMLGAGVFFADLIRKIELDIVCDLVSVSSYRNTTTAAHDPDLLMGPREDWCGRHLLFVEAIVDTGKTARMLLQMARDRHAASARMCTLLDKPSRRLCEVGPDYTGFTIPDTFVVGYGLDYCGMGRNRPGIETIPADMLHIASGRNASD